VAVNTKSSTSCAALEKKQKNTRFAQKRLRFWRPRNLLISEDMQRVFRTSQDRRVVKTPQQRQKALVANDSLKAVMGLARK
jgi:hypothetical protein